MKGSILPRDSVRPRFQASPKKYLQYLAYIPKPTDRQTSNVLRSQASSEIHRSIPSIHTPSTSWNTFTCRRVATVDSANWCLNIISHLWMHSIELISMLYILLLLLSYYFCYGSHKIDQKQSKRSTRPPSTSCRIPKRPRSKPSKAATPIPRASK